VYSPAIESRRPPPVWFLALETDQCFLNLVGRHLVRPPQMLNLDVVPRQFFAFHPIDQDRTRGSGLSTVVAFCKHVGLERSLVRRKLKPTGKEKGYPQLALAEKANRSSIVPMEDSGS
jgi:hypothetical protein